MNSSFSFSSGMRVVLSLLSLILVLTLVNGVYTGPRYGKRDSGDTVVGRVLRRTNALRNIQSRSAGQRRFYPGTRYSGKRASWQETPILTSDGDLSAQPLPLSSIPYDCLYVPFVGVRCSHPQETPSYWRSLGNTVTGDEETYAGTVNNENGNNEAVTGVDP